MAKTKSPSAWAWRVIVCGAILGIPGAALANDNPALGIGEPTTDPCGQNQCCNDPNCCDDPPCCVEPPCDCAGFGSPVSARFGSMKRTFTDLEYRLGDIQFVIDRTYSSDDIYVGHFGRGFTSALDHMSISTFNGNTGSELVVLRTSRGQRFQYIKQPDGSYTGPVGQFETLVKTATDFELTDLDGVVYTFAADTGFVVSRADKNGHTVLFTHNAGGQLTGIELFPGRDITMTYGANGLVESISDFGGRTVSYEYDASGNLTLFTDAEGNPWTYQYNTAGLLSAVINPLAETSVSVAYDVEGRVQTLVDSEGDYTYTYAANSTTKRDNALSTLLAPVVVSETIFYDSEGVITKHRDASGHDTNFGYDALFSLTSQSNANGGVTQFEFDALGRITREVYPDLSEKQFTWHPTLNLKTSETNENGVLSEWAYDLSGNLTRQTLAKGTPHEEVTTYAYDGAGHVTQRVDPGNLITTMEYDTFGNLTRETRPGPISVSYQYDVLGRRTRQVDDALNEIVYEYDALGRHTKTIDPEGNQSMELYDAAGRLTSKVLASGATTTFEYNAFDRLTRQVNGVGGATVTDYTGPYPTRTADDIGREKLFAYDIVGNITQVTENFPNDGTKITTITYDNAGFELQKNDPDALDTTRTYDARNRIKTLTRPDGVSETYAYDAAGNLTSKTDQWGNVHTTTYDELNRVEAQGDSFGTRVITHRDNAGREFELIWPRGTETTLYDAAGRRSRSIDADSNSLDFQYDTLGRLTSVIRPGGLATTVSLDGLGRTTSILWPTGRTTGITYHGTNLTASVTEEGGRVTTYAYDLMDNVTTQGLPDGSKYQFAYDPAARLTRYTLPSGDSFTYEYSDTNLLTKVIYPNLTETTYTYNEQKQITSVSKGLDTVSMAYDPQGRLTSRTYGGRTILYSYSPDGLTKTTTYPSGRVVTRVMDPRQRTSTVSIDGDATPLATYAYDADDVPLSVSYNNGVDGSYTFSGERFITGATYTAPDLSLIRGWSVGVNDLGNVTYSERLDDPARSFQVVRDLNDRVTERRVGVLDASKTVPAPVRSESWILDGVGNWNSYTLDGVTETRAHDLNNRITQRTQGAPVTFTYDANGNLTDDGTHLYVYDFDGLLTEVRLKSDNSLIESYKYDPMGNLVSITTGAGDTVELVRDGEHAVESYRNGSLESVNVYGGRVDDHVATIINGTRYYYLADPCQNVAAITDANGKVVESYEYDTYGRPMFFDSNGTQLAGSAVGNEWLYNGRLYRSSTGLHYYRTRFMSPDLGRYMSPDQLGTVGQEYIYNLYEYTNSSPLEHVDPFGWCKSKCVSTSLDFGDDLTGDKGMRGKVFSFGVGPWKIGVSLTGSGSVENCQMCCDDGRCAVEVKGSLSLSGGASAEFEIPIGGFVGTILTRAAKAIGGKFGVFATVDVSGSMSRTWSAGGCDGRSENNFCLKLEAGLGVKGGIATPPSLPCSASAWVYGGGSASYSCCSKNGGPMSCKTCASGKVGVKGSYSCGWGKEDSWFQIKLKDSFDITFWEVKASGC